MKYFFPLLLAVIMLATLIIAYLIKRSESDGKGEKNHPFKWRGLVPLIIRFLSQLLKSVWLFFPGILFLLLSIACFWYAGQGKDMIVAFMSNRTHTLDFGSLSWSYTRIFFFIAISFWVYVSWYSSRIIYYIKVEKQNEPADEISKLLNQKIPQQGKSYPDIRSLFLAEFPRLIGQACFILIELAILQSPLFENPLSSGPAILLFFELLIVFYFINRRVEQKMAHQSYFQQTFYILLILFLAAVVCVSFLKTIYPFILLLLLILMHVLFIVYSNWRREELKRIRRALPQLMAKPRSWSQRVSAKIMQNFCIPAEELDYFKWLILIAIFGIVIYLGAINSLAFARYVGPFSFAFLGFSVLLAFGYIVTAYSIKMKLNLHVILFLIAFVFGIRETHQVRTRPLYATPVRPNLERYLRAWMQKNADGGDSVINMYFVMSNGGASRSGYWTAQVLGRLQDSSLHSRFKFSDQVFCLSGTSGGGVGVAAYFSALKGRQHDRSSQFQHSLASFLKQDYFTYTFARLLGPDFFRYMMPLIRSDRAAALEESFENSYPDSTDLFHTPFNDSLSSFPALTEDHTINLPILCINTTRVQDGNPGVVSNLLIDESTFNKRVDVVDILEKEKSDISMASGAILGARFPYLSPAGQIGSSYFVDGGYFDNSGAGVIQEIIRGIINIGKKSDPILSHQIERIHFHVIHIVNSPIDSGPAQLQPISSIQNDLFAPVLTILGAYDMQTTVNDARLRNYLRDLNPDTAGSLPRTDYTRISLYESSQEWEKDSSRNKNSKSEPPYPMNWFMSDATISRIDKRLETNDTLQMLIGKLNHPGNN